MKLKEFFTAIFYTGFVLLNIVQVHACEVQTEESCCSSACCADEPMDCCEIEDEQEDHANEHALVDPVQLNKLILSAIIGKQLPSLSISSVDQYKLVRCKRPPPLRAKLYIENQQLVLYA